VQNDAKHVLLEAKAAGAAALERMNKAPEGKKAADSATGKARFFSQFPKLLLCSGREDAKAET
jgi:hypothetical protein